MGTRHRKDAPPLQPYRAAEMLEKIVPFEREVLGFMPDVPREDRVYAVLGILHDVLLTPTKALNSDEWGMHLRFGDGGPPPAGKPRA